VPSSNKPRASAVWVRAWVLLTVMVGVVAGLLMPTAAAYGAPSIDQIEKQIRTMSARLEHTVEQYNKVTEELKASRARANALDARITLLQTQMDVASSEVNAAAVSAYKGGDLAAINSVLASGSIGVLVDRILLIDQIARQRQADIATYRAAKAQVDAQRGNLAEVLVAERKQRDDLTVKRVRITRDLARLYALRKLAYGRIQVAAGSGYHGTPPYVPGKAGVVVRYAFHALGARYVWAAAGPYGSGYDCSGLTLAAWRAAGVTLPHNAAMQWGVLPHISRSSLRPGDLVFYHNLGHVGIYVGNGQVIHAPTFGEVVKISSVDMMPPYGYARPR
jgi:peptidoglycan DL-endopeptidase CwlO